MQNNSKLKTQNSKLNTQHSKLFSGIYTGKKVFITGHTGFKGSWLSFWLKKLGANIYGYSLKLPSTPNHYSLLQLNIDSEINDIRNYSGLKNALINFKPEIIFHLAAQPIVRYSYKNPIETFETNLLGTVNLLEAARNTPSIKAIVCISTDKCYENIETTEGYKENSPMGGYDPYSASKGCMELTINSYRNSFFNIKDYKSKHQTLIASCRAGNVIGGGDWGYDRLIPDIVKNASENKITEIRNLFAVRPWQHVLESISAYLQLGQKLLEEKVNLAGPWNIGPTDKEHFTVNDVIKLAQQTWTKIQYNEVCLEKNPHEAKLLVLNCDKANKILNWKKVWEFEETVRKTVSWYKEFYEKDIVNTDKNLKEYIKSAKIQVLDWIQ